MASIGFLARRSGVDPSKYEIPAVLNPINGSIAGGISGLFTTPLDVLKTRSMTFYDGDDPQNKRKNTEFS